VSIVPSYEGSASVSFILKLIKAALDELMPKRTKEADSPKEDDFFGSSQCDRKSLFPLR